MIDHITLRTKNTIDTYKLCILNDNTAQVEYVRSGIEKREKVYSTNIDWMTARRVMNSINAAIHEYRTGVKTSAPKSKPIKYLVDSDFCAIELAPRNYPNHMPRVA